MTGKVPGAERQMGRTDLQWMEYFSISLGVQAVAQECQCMAAAPVDGGE